MVVKKTHWLFLVLIISFTSCEKEKSIEKFTCNLLTISNVVAEETIEVTYKLEATGDYTISYWFYMDENGKVELFNPEVPSEIKVSLSHLKKMQSGAAGSVTEGSIKISYTAISATSSYIGIDQCEQKVN